MSKSMSNLYTQSFFFPKNNKALFSLFHNVTNNNSFIHILPTHSSNHSQTLKKVNLVSGISLTDSITFENIPNTINMHIHSLGNIEKELNKRYKAKYLVKKNNYNNKISIIKNKRIQLRQEMQNCLTKNHTYEINKIRLNDEYSNYNKQKLKSQIQTEIDLFNTRMQLEFSYIANTTTNSFSNTLPVSKLKLKKATEYASITLLDEIKHSPKQTSIKNNSHKPNKRIHNISNSSNNNDNNIRTSNNNNNSKFPKTNLKQFKMDYLNSKKSNSTKFTSNCSEVNLNVIQETPTHHTNANTLRLKGMFITNNTMNINNDNNYCSQTKNKKKSFSPPYHFKQIKSCKKLQKGKTITHKIIDSLETNLLTQHFKENTSRKSKRTLIDFDNIKVIQVKSSLKKERNNSGNNNNNQNTITNSNKNRNGLTVSKKKLLNAVHKKKIIVYKQVNTNNNVIYGNRSKNKNNSNNNTLKESTNKNNITVTH